MGEFNIPLQAAVSAVVSDNRRGTSILGGYEGAFNALTQSHVEIEGLLIEALEEVTIDTTETVGQSGEDATSEEIPVAGSGVVPTIRLSNVKGFKAEDEILIGYALDNQERREVSRVIFDPAVPLLPLETESELEPGTLELTKGTEKAHAIGEQVARVVPSELEKTLEDCLGLSTLLNAPILDDAKAFLSDVNDAIDAVDAVVTDFINGVLDLAFGVVKTALAEQVNAVGNISGGRGPDFIHVNDLSGFKANAYILIGHKADNEESRKVGAFWSGGNGPGYLPLDKAVEKPHEIGELVACAGLSDHIRRFIEDIQDFVKTAIKTVIGAGLFVLDETINLLLDFADSVGLTALFQNDCFKDIAGVITDPRVAGTVSSIVGAPNPNVVNSIPTIPGVDIGGLGGIL